MWSGLLKVDVSIWAILKGYVKNHNQPEGCIVECYIYEEAIEFCSEYLFNVEAIGLLKSHFIKKKDDNNKTGQPMVTFSQDLLCQAHRYVLNNGDKIQPYIKEHMNYIRHINPVRSMRENCIADEHNKSFIN